jgi:hypothetical protein
METKKYSSYANRRELEILKMKRNQLSKLAYGFQNKGKYYASKYCK